jgi:hypothetical protein
MGAATPADDLGLAQRAAAKGNHPAARSAQTRFVASGSSEERQALADRTALTSSAK